MSPEIYRNETYGFEVDMWAFGVLFYFMLNMEFPFSNLLIKNRNKPARSLIEEVGIADYSLQELQLQEIRLAIKEEDHAELHQRRLGPVQEDLQPQRRRPHHLRQDPRAPPLRQVLPLSGQRLEDPLRQEVPEQDHPEGQGPDEGQEY